MNGNRIWLLGATTAIIAVVALGWLLGVSPKLGAAEASLAEQQNVEAQNAALEASLVTLREQFENIDVLGAELTALQAGIPAGPDVETFLDELAALAAQTGVTLTAITAAEAIPYAGPGVDAASVAVAPTVAGGTDAAASAPVATGLVGQLFTVAVSVTVVGPPEALIDFTGAIQNGTRLALIDAVDFSSGEGASGTVSGHVFVVRATPIDSASSLAASTVPETEPAVAAG